MGNNNTRSSTTASASKMEEKEDHENPTQLRVKKGYSPRVNSETFSLTACPNNQKNHLIRLNDDVFQYFLLFLPRTDQVALKLTSKHLFIFPFFQELLTAQRIYEEIRLYLRTIHDFDYAWKNSQHMLIRHAYPQSTSTMTAAATTPATPAAPPPSSSSYSIDSPFIVTWNLWWFDLVATYEKIFPGQYVMLFYNTIPSYTVEFELTTVKEVRTTDGGKGMEKAAKIEENEEEVEVIKWSVTCNKRLPMDLVRVVIPRKGNLLIHFKEYQSYKHQLQIHYLLFVPQYYWNHLKLVLPLLNQEAQGGDNAEEEEEEDANDYYDEEEEEEEANHYYNEEEEEEWEDDDDDGENH